MKRIALIEDDEDIAFTLRLHLEREGYKVAHYACGQDGLLAVRRGGTDLVILDLNLPDLDGLTICREIRQDHTARSVPIVVLTARSSERDRVTGLELGADDYISKPFSVRELVARLGAILRRAGEEKPAVYEDRELRIDEKAYRVLRRGKEIRLARKEFELLWLLVCNRAAAVSRDRMLAEIWGVSSDVVETRTVDAHIRSLRKKLGSERISTVVGVGYRYEPSQE